MSNFSEARLMKLPGDDTGQVATEYALVCFWTVIAIWGSFALLKEAVFDFYYELASLICLPIP